MDSVGGAGALIFSERLDGCFDFSDGVGVEEFAEVGFTERSAEL